MTRRLFLKPSLQHHSKIAKYGVVLGEVVGIVLLVGVVCMGLSPGKAAAVSLNLIPEDIEYNMAQFDSSTPCLTDGRQFDQFDTQWLSIVGDPTNEDYGTQPTALLVTPNQQVLLAVSSLTFLCHISTYANYQYNGGTNNDPGPSGTADSDPYTTDPTSPYNDPTYPLARDPGNFLSVQSNAVFGSATASSPAGLQYNQPESVTNNAQQICYQSTTRYWFAGSGTSGFGTGANCPSQPATQFTWTAPSTAVPSDGVEINFSVEETEANWFDEEGTNIYQCVVPDTPGGTGRIVDAYTYNNPTVGDAFNKPCPPTYIQLSIWVKGPPPSIPPPQITAGPTGTCQSVTGNAVDSSGQGVNISLNMLPIASNAPIVGMAATPDGGGYWLVGSDGGVFSFGDAQFHGSAAGVSAYPIKGIAADNSTGGYWLVGEDGGVFSYGAPFYGSNSLGSNTGAFGLDFSAIASRPQGDGYWIVTDYGSVYAFGNAPNLDPTHAYIPGYSFSNPIVGIASTPDGGGYWLVAANGAIYAYGDAGYAAPQNGSVPIVGIAADPGGGFRTVGSGGQVYDYGGANYRGGSPSGVSNVVGIASTPNDSGYWLVGSDGGVFTYPTDGSGAQFYGSMPGDTWSGYYASSPSGSFTIASSNTYWPYVIGSQRTFTVTAYNGDGTTTSAPFTIGPCATFIAGTCSISVSPGTAVVGSTLTADLSIGYQAYGSQNLNGTMTASVSSGGGTIYSQNYNQTVSGEGSLTAKPTFSEPSAGTYTVTLAFSGNISENCSTTFTLYYAPYLKVNGGDVDTGSSFDTSAGSCGSNPNAPADTVGGVISWNQDNAGSYGGAGSPFAVYALGPIDGFASGQGTSTNSGDGLSFANTNATPGVDNPGSDYFGGGFDVSHCSVDYFDNRADTQDISAFPGFNSATNTLSLSALTSGTSSYYANTGSTLNITDSSSVSNGVEATIYVNGNVYIKNNIDYANPNGWTSFADIPKIEIVASGNIYIAPTVSELDGIYIAQPVNNTTQGTGIIYTCSNGPPNATAFPGYTTCNNQLNVYGSFISSETYYGRTYGNLYGTSSVSGGPAEQFFYSPEVWLAGAAAAGPTTTQTTTVPVPPQPSTPPTPPAGKFTTAITVGCTSTDPATGGAFLFEWALPTDAPASHTVTINIYPNDSFVDPVVVYQTSTPSGGSGSYEAQGLAVNPGGYGLYSYQLLVSGYNQQSTGSTAITPCTKTVTTVITSPPTPVLAPCEARTETCYDSITSLPPVL